MPRSSKTWLSRPGDRRRVIQVFLGLQSDQGEPIDPDPTDEKALLLVLERLLGPVDQPAIAQMEEAVATRCVHLESQTSVVLPAWSVRFGRDDLYAGHRHEDGAGRRDDRRPPSPGEIGKLHPNASSLPHGRAPESRCRDARSLRHVRSACRRHRALQSLQRTGRNERTKPDPRTPGRGRPAARSPGAPGPPTWAPRPVPPVDEPWLRGQGRWWHRRRHRIPGWWTPPGSDRRRPERNGCRAAPRATMPPWRTGWAPPREARPRRLEASRGQRRRAPRTGQNRSGAARPPVVSPRRGDAGPP